MDTLIQGSITSHSMGNVPTLRPDPREWRIPSLLSCCRQLYKLVKTALAYIAGLI